MKLQKKQTISLPVVQTVVDAPIPTEPYWSPYVQGVTQGTLARFNACPERHRLHIVEGLSPVRFGTVSNSAMDFGSLVHDILDKIYTRWSECMSSGKKAKPDNAHDWLDELIDEMFARDIKAVRSVPMAAYADAEERIDETFSVAKVLLHAYIRRWSADFGGLEWLALERIFEVPYPTKKRLDIDAPDVIIRGKRDGEFRAGSKRRLRLFETKTKARIEEEQIVNRLSFDLQVMTYLWSMLYDYNGEMPEGVLYNVIRRPQLRRGKAESIKDFCARISTDIRRRTDFYFVRYSGTITRQEFQAWMKEFDAMMWRLVSHYEHGRGHFRDSGACAGRLGVCEYLDLCGGSGDITMYARREHVFPELAG